MMLPEIGAAQRPMRNETICGDAFVVLRSRMITIAVADGLGHGPKAAEAAVAFCAYAEANVSKGLEEILRGATAEISHTRGAAAALLRIEDQPRSLSFVGIGNIELQAVSTQPIRPMCTPGIVGRPLRKVLKFDYELNGGEVLAVHSDGISSRFKLESYGHLNAQRTAEAILAEHGKRHDDATCLVVKL
jgi:hypothetical protein